MCTGIGKETARVLALRGAQVVLACRDETKGQTAVSDILRTTGVAADKVQCMKLDLTSFASVREFAAAYLAKDLPINMLILNAGIMAPWWALTADGYESQFGVNHLAHFLLTSLLIEKIKASAPARIISLSSEGHRMGGEGCLTLVKEEKDYSPWPAYGQSKLANILFTTELNRRLANTGVSANAVHPGIIHTELARSTTLGTMFYTIGSVFQKSIPQGAATTCYVATNPAITWEASGKYFADSNVSPCSGEAQDLSLAQRLWALSELETGATLLLPINPPAAE